MSEPRQSLKSDNIKRYFEISLYLMVVSGFATLASTGKLSLAWSGFVAAALVLRGYQLAALRSRTVPESWTRGVTIGYVLFYLLDYFVLSREFVASAVHLVLFLVVVRLFSARRERDHRFLAAIASVMVLAAAILTVDSTYLLNLAVFMMIAAVTFILMEMRSSSAAAARRFEGQAADSRHMALSLAGVSPVLVALTLAGATGIFFLLPRTSAGYLNALAPSGSFATGFSDRVELGQIGEIQQSSTVVMHVEIDGDMSGEHDLRLRGIALRDFDGTTWSNPYRPYAAPMLGRGRFDVRVRSQRELHGLVAGARQAHYRVLMEPLGLNLFFLPADAQTLEGNYRNVMVDDGGAVFNGDPERVIGVYDGWSVFPPAGYGAGAEPAPQAYLRLQRLDPRVARLAAQVTAQAGDDYERAQELEKYLLTNFRYTLQLGNTKPPDPVAYFLFERRQGHCEYFASAMAVMLRTLGIPSRVVTGFRSGEFNDVTAKYVVRASNAHAWVEAYFPGRGWVSFDPTPPSVLPIRTGWERFALYTDAVASFWREWIVNYDAAHQTTVGHELARGGRRLFDQTNTWGREQYESLMRTMRRLAASINRNPVRWGMVTVGGFMLLGLLISGRKLWQAARNWRLAARPADVPAAAATLWYGRMTRAVERKGWSKAPAQTPQEFAKSIQDVRVRETVAEFTSHYEGARFGESADDALALAACYEKVVSSTRGAGSASAR